MCVCVSVCVFMVGGKTILCKKKKTFPMPFLQRLHAVGGGFFLPRFLFLPHHLAAVSYHDAFSLFFLFEYLFSFFLSPTGQKRRWISTNPSVVTFLSM